MSVHEVSKDPWRQVKRRHSDLGTPLTSNGHIDHISRETSNSDDDAFCNEDKDNNTDTIKVYRRRFYILFVFALSPFAQYCAWNAFGPISGTVKQVFGWGNTEIALLAGLDAITYMITMLFFSWMMDVKGLRISLVLSVFLMFVGTGLRCVTRDPNMIFWTIVTGQFLNGLAGPVTQAAPPLLSSAWFPRKERTTATAVASLCGSLGVAFSFLIGPNIVGGVDHSSFQTPSQFSDLSSNYSFLHQKIYENKSLPLSETLYKDAVHYWPMDNLSNEATNRNGINTSTTLQSNQFIYDEKSAIVGKVISNIQLIPGQVRSALHTDGTTGFVNLGNHVNTCLGNPSLCTNGMTVSLWIKYEAWNETRYFLGTSGTDIRAPGFVVYAGDYMTVSVRTGKKAWSVHVLIPRDTWTHLLFRWDPREGLYAHTNGTFAGRSKDYTRTSSLDSYHTVFTLGRANDEYELSSASFDELSVWYNVLSEQEVKAIYATTSSINIENREAQFTQERSELLQKREDEIMRLMYIEFGVVAVLFFLILLYFPDKPPTPPSMSASVEREDFSAGFKQLLKHKQFWTLAMIYGITTGVYSGWGAVLALNLEAFDISQTQAGWIGFYSTIAGIFAGVLLARFSDFFGGRMKTLLLFLFFCSSLSFLWFSLLCLHIIPFSEASLYPASIIGGFSISGTIPLFYELTVECTYPIAEGVTTGVLTLVNNIWTFIFLLVAMIPGIGTLWMNWCLFASCAGCIPILLCFKERYGRLVVDRIIEVKKPDDGECEDHDFKQKTIFTSTLSMTAIDQFMEKFHKSKESQL